MTADPSLVVIVPVLVGLIVHAAAEARRDQAQGSGDGRACRYWADALAALGRTHERVRGEA